MGGPFQITYLPYNGVYEKEEHKQIRVDGLDNARMLLTHAQCIRKELD